MPAVETPTATPTETPTETPTATPTETPTGGGPPVVTGGTTDGSDTGTGDGPPNLGPTCLRVYEVGPNHVPDGGMPDDEFLGQGGTDGSGHFSIMLNRKLVTGDVIFVIDVCDPFSPGDPFVGPTQVVTGTAPAPALSPGGLAGALILLSLIGLIGLLRRQRRS